MQYLLNLVGTLSRFNRRARCAKFRGSTVTKINKTSIELYGGHLIGTIHMKLYYLWLYIPALFNICTFHIKY